MRNKAKLLSLAPFPHLTFPSSLQTPLPLPTLFASQVSPWGQGAQQGAARGHQNQLCPGQPQPLPLSPEPHCPPWARAPHTSPNAKTGNNAHAYSLQMLSWACDHTSHYFRSNYEAVLLMYVGGTIPFETWRAKASSAWCRRGQAAAHPPAHLHHLLPSVAFIFLSLLSPHRQIM